MHAHEKTVMAGEGDATEVQAQEAWKRRDFEAVTNIVLTAYGGELYSFLLAQFRGRANAADDAFSLFSEDLWRALAAFQWRCSLRAFCYKLARSASSRYRRSPHERPGRQIPLSAARQLEMLVARTRTSTQAYLRTEVKDKVRELREKLTRDEQDLLVLRVDRDLPWRDVAHAMLDEGEGEGEGTAPDESRLQRLDVSLRQRFTEVKKRLKQLAEEAGLI